MVLGGDLDCSLVTGEEPDVLCLGDDLVFFNSKESFLHLSSGEDDFFLISNEDPGATGLRGERDVSLKARGDLDPLCLRCGDLGFSFVPTDLPDLLCCSGDADFDSGEAARLIGDKEFSFADD